MLLTRTDVRSASALCVRAPPPARSGRDRLDDMIASAQSRSARPTACVGSPSAGVKKDERCEVKSSQVSQVKSSRSRSPLPQAEDVCDPAPPGVFLQGEEKSTPRAPHGPTQHIHEHILDHRASVFMFPGSCFMLIHPKFGPAIRKIVYDTTGAPRPAAQGCCV